MLKRLYIHYINTTRLSFWASPISIGSTNSPSHSRLPQGVGRTGRAGAAGEAFTLVSKEVWCCGGGFFRSLMIPGSHGPNPMGKMRQHMRKHIKRWYV